MSVQIASSCPLCKSVDQLPYRTVDGYRIVRCARCRFLFVSPMPTSEKLTSFYQHAEYYAGSALGYADYMGERVRHEQLAHDRLQRIERLRPRRGRILDV